MKIAKLFIINLVPLSLLLGGVYLAYNGIEGWGWVIFLGAMIGYAFNKTR